MIADNFVDLTPFIALRDSLCLSRQNVRLLVRRRIEVEKPPRRFIAGADAVGTAEQAAATLKQQTDAYRELSSSLAYDDVKAA